MLDTSEKAVEGMRAKRGKNSGALDMSGTWLRPTGLRLPGGRRRHHKARGCACIGKDLLELSSPVSLCAALSEARRKCSRLLKLVTGVEISTLPARRSDKEVKATNSIKRRTAAAPNRVAFRLSMTMIGLKLMGELAAMVHARVPRFWNWNWGICSGIKSVQCVISANFLASFDNCCPPHKELQQPNCAAIDLRHG